MRVISGDAGGRKLSAPENNDIRPTTDNVKESLFNIIQFEIQGRKVLDLFAGTGQLGIECLSRGASEVVFSDSSSYACNLIKKNLGICGYSAEVINSDAISVLKRQKVYDIILVDPPYESDLYEKVIQTVELFDILSDGGIIVFESNTNKIIPQLDPPYYLKKTYVYGKVKLSVVTKDSERKSLNQ